MDFVAKRLEARVKQGNHFNRNLALRGNVGVENVAAALRIVAFVEHQRAQIQQRRIFEMDDVENLFGVFAAEGDKFASVEARLEEEPLPVVGGEPVARVVEPLDKAFAPARPARRRKRDVVKRDSGGVDPDEKREVVERRAVVEGVAPRDEAVAPDVFRRAPSALDAHVGIRQILLVGERERVHNFRPPILHKMGYCHRSQRSAHGNIVIVVEEILDEPPPCAPPFFRFCGDVFAAQNAVGERDIGRNGIDVEAHYNAILRRNADAGSREIRAENVLGCAVEFDAAGEVEILHLGNVGKFFARKNRVQPNSARERARHLRSRNVDDTF